MPDRFRHCLLYTSITYTGKFDDVQKLDELVEAYNQEHPKLPIRIHVDGASGGMFAPRCV